MLRELERLELPESSELSDPEQNRVREADEREISNPDWLVRLDYRLRLQVVLSELTRRCAPSALVIDVASAQANLPIFLEATGRVAIATDLRSAYLSYGRMKAPERRLRAVVCSGDRVPLRASCADAVVMGELLEHVAHPEHFLAEAVRLLRPGGVVVATTPNGEHRWSELPTYTAARSHIEDFEPHQFGPDGGDHLFLYTAAELKQLLMEAGLDPVSITPFFSDVVARGAVRIRQPRPWKYLSSTWSPQVAEVLRVADRALVRALPIRTALGLIAVARRP